MESGCAGDIRRIQHRPAAATPGNLIPTPRRRHSGRDLPADRRYPESRPGTTGTTRPTRLDPRGPASPSPVPAARTGPHARHDLGHTGFTAKQPRTRRPLRLHRTLGDTPTPRTHAGSLMMKTLIDLRLSCHGSSVPRYDLRLERETRARTLPWAGSGHVTTRSMKTFVTTPQKLSARMVRDKRRMQLPSFVRASLIEL